MIKKLCLAAAVVVGSVAFAQSGQAGDCYRGHGHHHGRAYSYGYARRPVVSVTVPRYGVYRPPVYGYPGSFYRSYSPYRAGYYGRGIGYGPGFGYGGFGPYYRGSGMSFGIGF